MECAPQLQSCSIVYARAGCLYTSCQWPNESRGPDPPLRALQSRPSLPLTIFSLICPLSVPSSQTASHASRCSYHHSIILIYVPLLLLPKKHSSAALPISDRDRVCVCFSSVTGSSCCCDLLNDLHHFLNLRRSGKNARNKWHSDVGRARSDARPAAKMGCRVEILPEKYSRITTDTLVLQQRNIEADLQNQKGV